MNHCLGVYHDLTVKILVARSNSLIVFIGNQVLVGTKKLANLPSLAMNGKIEDSSSTGLPSFKEIMVLITS